MIRLLALVLAVLLAAGPAYAERPVGLDTLAGARYSTTEVGGGGARDSTTEVGGGGARYSPTEVGGGGARYSTTEHARPLAGRVIVIDPGHQLGNHNFPRKINRPVPAGGFRKPCNTTGTATNGGYPEATFVWRVSKALQSRLERLGATVKLTRTTNSQRRWGPCVDARGRAGNQVHADAKISVHGDGSYASGARGFHVIAPTDRRPWTHDIYKPSKRLAVDTRAALKRKGVPVANYIAGGDGLDFRSDLGTLNLSDIPTVMVELGNMRNASDAHRMTSPRGRQRYAAALADAVRRFLR